MCTQHTTHKHTHTHKHADRGWLLGWTVRTEGHDFEGELPSPTYVHTYIHAYIHTYIHTHTNTYILTYIGINSSLHNELGLSLREQERRTLNRIQYTIDIKARSPSLLLLLLPPPLASPAIIQLSGSCEWWPCTLHRYLKWWSSPRHLTRESARRSPCSHRRGPRGRR